MTGLDVDDLLSDLNDPDHTTWTLPERIVWMNAGVREIATAKPKACSATQSIALTLGQTRQVKPATAVALLDLTCNMGVDGATPSRRITAVSADALGASVPNWRRDLGAVVKHLVTDDRDPDAFYVWPGIKATATVTAWQVEALMQLHPTPIAAIEETLPLDNSYLNALVAYVMHMAYGRDAENGMGDMALAQYTKFAQILGIQVQRQKRAGPLANTRENPAYPAVDKNGAP